MKTVSIVTNSEVVVLVLNELTAWHYNPHPTTGVGSTVAHMRDGGKWNLPGDHVAGITAAYEQQTRGARREPNSGYWVDTTGHRPYRVVYDLQTISTVVYARDAEHAVEMAPQLYAGSRPLRVSLVEFVEG